ncbi:MAG: Do family serine endopeptidase [Candidatus Cloacimonadaceae bacterium]
MISWKNIVPLALLIMLISSVYAQPSVTQNRSDANELIKPAQNPVVEVVREVREAVVQIRVEAKITVRNPMNQFFDDPFFRYFFPEQPRTQQRPVTSMGSGFIYEFNPQTREAYIMTNNHVVDQGKDGTITVILADKVSYTAELVGRDPNTDVAVIKIEVKKGEKITVAPLGDSSKLEIGEWAIAIGNPFGEAGLDRTVTLGVISAIGRSNLNFGSGSPIYQDYIQTDAAINPGNSGGPLLNIDGEVIGINAAITSTSGGNIGIGFAIPINLANRVVEDLVAKGKVTRAYIGISPQEITSELMEAFDLEEVSGVLVAEVTDDSPANKAGVQVGDVIVEFNGEKVPNASKFRIAVATSKPGTTVPMKVIRDHKEKLISIQLENYPDEDNGIEEAKPEVKLSHGIKVNSLDSADARRLNVSGTEGVVITAVDNGSPAAKAGISVGQIILKVNNLPVNNPDEFELTMDGQIDAMVKSQKSTITLYVKDRNNRFQFVPVRFETQD